MVSSKGLTSVAYPWKFMQRQLLQQVLYDSFVVEFALRALYQGLARPSIAEEFIHKEAEPSLSWLISPQEQAQGRLRQRVMPELSWSSF
jgi:hypothetical protein